MFSVSPKRRRQREGLVILFCVTFRTVLSLSSAGCCFFPSFSLYPRFSLYIKCCESFSSSVYCRLLLHVSVFQVTETRTGPLGCSNYDNLDSVSSVLVQSPENKIHLQGWPSIIELPQFLMELSQCLFSGKLITAA